MELKGRVRQILILEDFDVATHGSPKTYLTNLRKERREAVDGGEEEAIELKGGVRQRYIIHDNAMPVASCQMPEFCACVREWRNEKRVQSAEWRRVGE